MKKISSVSSIGRERLKVYDVERKNFVDSVDKVDRVDRIKKVKNDLQNQNYTLSNDSFYDHLKKSKDNIKDFVMNEHELKRQLESGPSKKLDRDLEDVYKNVQMAVKTINECMKSIKIIDALSGEANYNILIHSEETKYMERIGIRVKNGFFEIEQRILKNEIYKNKSCANIIFDPDSGMLRKTLNVLEKAKAELVRSSISKKEGDIIDRMV